MSSSSRHAELVKSDLAHLWHPFTQAQHWEEDDMLVIERGEGCHLIDVEGRRYLDGVSSLWCNVHGHSVPELVDALTEQANTLCHSTMLGLTHVPAIELADELIQFLPASLTRVFYADDGSTAVEAALRMGLEWWQKQGAGKGLPRTRFASLMEAYHGDTLGAVGVGYVESFHKYCRSGTVPAFRIPAPHYFRFSEGAPIESAEEQSLSALDVLLAEKGDEIAAFIIEPLVQGAAGILTHSPAYLRAVAERLQRRSVLLIVDEVATGFGKTGTMFAFEQAGIVPDILVVGKGFSGGYLPISAAIASEQIYDAFRGHAADMKTFFYGQTFAGNPLAAAVARANLRLFKKNRVTESLAPKIAHFHRELDRHVAPLAAVDEIRHVGVMVGIELTSTPGMRDPFDSRLRVGPKIVQEARKRGVIIRPLGNVMVLMPPLVMSEGELSTLVQVTAEAIIQGVKQ